MIRLLSAHVARSELVAAELHLLSKDNLAKGYDLDDHLAPESATMTEVLWNPNLVDRKEDDIVQLKRKGYFRIDKAVGDGLGGEQFCLRFELVGRTQVR